MHQLRYYLTVKRDFVPLETLRIRYRWGIGTGKVTVM